MSRPVDLEEAVAAVWDRLAPHATAEGTLRPGTSEAFEDLCRYVVLERQLGASSTTIAGPDHRAMMIRVESLKHRFRLIPDGKPVVVAKPEDAWEEFDTPLKVVGGNG